MSSMVAFARALVMLACLVAVPILAVTHPSAFQRARQAAARFLSRLTNESESQGRANDRTAASPLRRSSAANHVARAERPPADSPPWYPEPINDVPGRSDVPRDDMLPAQPADDRPGQTEAPQSGSFAWSTASLVADWQEKASELQHLGAVEYALEKWGDSENLYRFHCLVAARGTHTYRRHFEAVDENGGRAIEEVVQQVRSWHEALSRAK